MNTIRLHAFGASENLRYEEMHDPVPGPGQVRVIAVAARVYSIDYRRLAA